MNADVLIQYNPASISIILNRPQAIHSLTIPMIETIKKALQDAMQKEWLQFVIFYANGGKGFCAGGDIKALYTASVAGDSNYIKEFYAKEYDMDYMIHTYPKPVIAITDGITMGGGLGLVAGADYVIVSENTVMAMPESRIGFFPDVGSTGWLFTKCKPGYPKYLALTGDELHGGECVAVGLAHYQVLSHTYMQLIQELEQIKEISDIHKTIEGIITRYALPISAESSDRDRWVADYFDTDVPLQRILESLTQCSFEHELCNGVFSRIAQRSPTSLVLTDILLAANKGRPLEEVFAREHKAAMFMTMHHDYREGVRARIIDKDNKPCWQPERIEDVNADTLRRVVY